MHHNDTVTLAQFGLNNTFKKGDISAMLDKYIDKNTLLDKGNYSISWLISASHSRLITLMFYYAHDLLMLTVQ